MVQARECEAERATRKTFRECALACHLGLRSKWKNSKHKDQRIESNDGQVHRAGALKGLGILVQPSYILYDDIVAGGSCRS